MRSSTVGNQAIIKQDGEDNNVAIIFLSSKQDESGEENLHEWQKTTLGLGIHRIFVYPKKNEWYHDCMDKLVGNIEGVVKNKRKMTIGVSMGGYGAILLAHLLNCNSLSFAPQTNIEKAYDDRWPDANIIAERTQNPEWTDLGLLASKGKHHIYAGTLDMDIKQAKNLKGALITSVPECDNHNVARVLKRDGRLKQILKNKILDLKYGN